MLDNREMVWTCEKGTKMILFIQEKTMKKIISGKVREVYDLEDGRMVIVTTDRLSAFDVILPRLIPTRVRCSTPCPTSGSIIQKI